MRYLSSDNKKNFILSIISERPFAFSPEMDPGRLYHKAEKERVSGIIYTYSKQNNISKAIELFQKRYYAIATANVYIQKTLAELESKLAGQEQFPIVALKGACLLQIVYPDIGHRPMEDIDLLVWPHDFSKLAATLAKMEFHPHEHAPHLFVGEKGVIDVHTHALNVDRVPGRAALFPTGMDPVFDRAVPLGREFTRIQAPDDADNVLLLAQHAMKHSFAALIWLVDIFRLLKGRDAAFFEKLATRTIALKQEKSLGFSLYLLNRLFDFHLPEQMRGFTSPANISRLARVILDAKAAGHPIGQMGEVLSILCIPGAKGRIRFAHDVFFPYEGLATKGRTPSKMARATRLYRAIGMAGAQIKIAARLFFKK